MLLIILMKLNSITKSLESKGLDLSSRSRVDLSGIMSSGRSTMLMLSSNSYRTNTIKYSRLWAKYDYIYILYIFIECMLIDIDNVYINMFIYKIIVIEYNMERIGCNK